MEIKTWPHNKKTENNSRSLGEGFTNTAEGSTIWECGLRNGESLLGQTMHPQARGRENRGWISCSTSIPPVEFS